MNHQNTQAALTIGDVSLRHGLMLAPLAGVSDHPFRRICRAQGAEFTVSEMVSAKSLCYEKMSRRASVGENSKSAPLAKVWADDVPMAVQLFGSEPEFMAEAAAMVAEGSYAGCTSQAKPAAIDINMGCPVHKIVSNGEGSALLRDIPLAGRIVRAVAKAVDLPVTVKIRIGFDAKHICAVEMAKELEASGAAAICVHGRTREQMYRPGVDLDAIAAVKAAVSIPVIGNGDIMSVADALNMKEKTGCDGLMIARGAMGNPWLFAEIAAALEGREFVPPSLQERIETALSQMAQMIEEKGERVGFAESKKQMAWYIHGVVGAAEARGRLMTATTPCEVETVMRGLIR
ncbi:MAG: tRNA dihydrouridine synthase DusB [Clostridia bacterium]|nr:tRNA dihydrouridine synthase DusB [Clostridia bacterium]